MFFESAQEGKNGFWRYLVMFVVVFASTNLIGAIPLLVVMFIKGLQDPGILENTPENLMDFSVFGIDSNIGLLLLLFPFIIGLLTFFLLIKPMNNRSWKTVFNGGDGIRWSRFFFSALIWLILMGIYLFFSMKGNPDNFSINNVSASLIWLVIIALLFVPFQTGFEEVFFRGYLMQGAGVWFGNKWAPLILTSVLFGLMHAFNPEIKEFGFWLMMPQYICFGLVFGLLVVFDNGIELAMGAHAANNVFLSIFLTQESSALQTAAIFEQKEVYPWTDFLSLIIISGIFLLLMGIRYKWRFANVFKLNQG